MLKKIIICISIIFIAGCSISDPKKQSNDNYNPIIIGGLIGITGLAHDYGTEARNVINLRIAQWNEKGGIKENRKVIIKWIDGSCDYNVAKEAANQLIKEYNVSIILGGICSDETIGAASITEPQQVILISPASTSSKITNIGNFTFRTTASNTSQAKILARYAIDNKYQKIGVLIEKTEYTNDLLELFKNKYEGDILSLEIFPESKNTAINQIQELKKQKVDAILILAQGPEAVYKSISNLQKEDWQGGVLLNEIGIEDPNIILDFKDYLYSVKATGGRYAQAPETEKMRNFREQYKEQYDKEMKYTYFSAATLIDAVDVMMEALKYTEKVNDTTEIAKFLYSTQHSGYAGNISFDENGDVRGGFSLFQFDGQEFSKLEK